MQESSTDSKLSEESSTVTDSSTNPRLKILEQIKDSKTESSTDDVEVENVQEKSPVLNDNKPTAVNDDQSSSASADKTSVANNDKLSAVNNDKPTSANDDKPSVKKDQPSAINTSKDKPVDKVGFDLEFVPLDKDDYSKDTTPSLAYNRDRPLGKNRYFRRDPKAKIMKSDSDSSSDLTDNNKDFSTNDGKKRPHSHRNYRPRQEPGQQDDRRMTVIDERKRSDRGRGRRRNSGSRPEDDGTGETGAGYDRPDGRGDHRREHPDDGAKHRRGVDRPELHPANRKGR